MSRQANPAVIGAFVVTAMLLLAGAVLLLSDGAFKEKFRCVMYFEGSVKGLRIGAPVDFRGVTIGKVTDIRVVADYENNQYTIPVVAEFDRSGMTKKSDSDTNIQISLNELIDLGLRAQLNLQSLLTGQLFVQLDFYPDKEAKFQGDGHLPEIPTIPTPLEKLERSVADFDLEAALSNIAATMEGVQKLTNSPELLSAISNLDKALASFNELAGRLNADIGPILVGVNRTLLEAEDTLRELGDAANNAGGTFERDSELIYALHVTLNDLSKAAKSVQALADTVERNPEILLKGKKIRE